MSGTEANDRRRAELRRLIEETIDAVGVQDPETLPHVVRRRLEGRITGETRLDQLISEILAERGRVR